MITSLRRYVTCLRPIRCTSSAKASRTFVRCQQRKFCAAAAQKPVTAEQETLPAEQPNADSSPDATKDEDSSKPLDPAFDFSSFFDKSPAASPKADSEQKPMPESTWSLDESVEEIEEEEIDDQSDPRWRLQQLVSRRDNLLKDITNHSESVELAKDLVFHASSQISKAEAEVDESRPFHVEVKALLGKLVDLKSMFEPEADNFDRESRIELGQRIAGHLWVVKKLGSSEIRPIVYTMKADKEFKNAKLWNRVLEQAGMQSVQYDWLTMVTNTGKYIKKAEDWKSCLRPFVPLLDEYQKKALHRIELLETAIKSRAKGYKKHERNLESLKLKQEKLAEHRHSLDQSQRNLRAADEYLEPIEAEILEHCHLYGLIDPGRASERDDDE
eukprot:600230_1